ncbi:hypothetical protein F0562_007136 [Nyssa sinensis]|uniref:Protein EMBRYONIC FLOWER 1 n=1 Tax=Nyssa sinensis TaxID=561372 RepID=A0A5J5A778_9ASTE|nr:hypothetical protein F0562_007136 [Nyssa sinensis]
MGREINAIELEVDSFDLILDRKQVHSISMERSIVVNENHQRSNSTPVSKSLGSLIKIDSISIDLSSAMDKNDPGKCDHFSIRGYVAEMRKKDWRICLPFALDDNNKSEKQTSVLPPLHVAKFRWWRCQNCLREIGDTSAAESHGDAVMVLSDVRQASKMDNFEGRTADFNTYANVNTDEHCFSSCRYKKEMKSENGNSTAAIGCENGSEDDGNRKLCNPTCDVTKFNPLLLEEKRTDGTVLKSQGNGLVEYCEPNCGSHEIAIIVPAIETLNCMGRSSAEICQKGELASAYDQQRNVLTACKTAEVVGKIDEAVDPVKDQRTRLPSLELEDCDIVSSESDEILAGNSPHDRHHVLTSRKARKVRLLTELLGAKRNAENNQIRTEGAPTNAMMPCASPGLHALSAHQNQVPVEGNLTKGFRGIKRKTKMPRDEDWKPVEMSRPNNVTKKVRVFKGDAETTNTSIEIADSASEEDASAVVLKTDRKGHWTNHRINRNPTRGRKKNKETKVGDGYSPLVPWRGVVSGKNQIEIGDADKCGAAADMPKSAHGAFTGRGQQLYLESYLSPEQTERNLSFCKMKNKMPQVEDGQKYLSLKRNSMLGEGSIRRKDVEIMQTRPEGVKFQWVHDASAKNGLDLSLNSYMAIQRKDINYFTRIDGGVDPLMPQQKGITREEHWRGKDVMHVGETSCPHKSGPDTSFDRGLLCDLNETITHRTSFLREMQNCDPLVNDGSFSLRQKMDFSDSRNNEGNH